MSRASLPTGAIGLRKRVYLLMATGIVFPLALMGGVGITWLRAMDERTLSGRLSAAGSVTAYYDHELTHDLAVLQRLAAAVGADPGGADPARIRAAVHEAHQQFDFRESVFVLDAARNVLAEEPSGPVSAAPRAEIPLVEEVLREGVPRMSGLVLGERGAVVHELVPVRSFDGRVVGVAGGTFEPGRRELEKMLRHLKRGQTGYAELLDARGLVIASTVPNRAGKQAECRAHYGALIRERRPETARCEGCHADRGVSVAAAGDVATFVPLAAAPWGVLLRQSVGEALPTEGAIPWYALVAALLVQIGLVGAFAWGAARSVTRPVAVLTAEAERIAGGELAWPIPELGADEVGRLGKSLDRMRRNLRQSMERVAEANAQLEQRVEERTRALNEANARLREREEARGELLGKVIAAQEDERKRIARELHDETTQSLAVLAMGIEAAQDAIKGGRTPRLDEVKAVAVHTLEEVHRLILDLRPSVLDDLGLLSAIRWYAERQLQSRGIAVRCEFGELDRRLPPELETALFRVCQEAMSNVARHAQASAVLIQVAPEDGSIRIEIEDDGKGFDPEAVTRREGRRPWGLMGIRERAELMGGTATLHSSPGQGTHLVVTIPLPAQAADGGGAAGGTAPARATTGEPA